MKPPPILDPPSVVPAGNAPDPEFFTRPPPPGRSRESTITLDADGRFRHDGDLVEHPRLAEAMHTWIDRHPLDGRPILNNGYDWTYFTVVDVPYFVRSVLDDGAGFPLVVLSDGSTEPLSTQVRLGAHDTLYVQVKGAAPGGPSEARFSRHAQAALGPYLVEHDAGSSGETVGLRTRAGTVPLPL